MNAAPRFSAVNEFEVASPADAAAYFLHKLRLEVDPSDVHFDLEKGIHNFVLIDTRSASDFEREHIPGAINLPHRQMNEETTKEIPRDRIIVPYCSGTECNGSTKGALNLARLGFNVKEMTAGIGGWKLDGFKTSAT